MSPVHEGAALGRAESRDRFDSVVLGSASALILSFLIVELYSLDVWWQVAIGEDILRSWSIPTVDRYTVAGQGRPYHDSHWLFQVLLALSHRLGGLVGVSLLPAVIWAGTLGVVYSAARRYSSVLMTSILTVAVALVSSERFLPRPELITMLMIPVFYFLFSKGAHRSWLGVLGLAVLQVAWANSHGLFVIGPFIAGCFLVHDLWARYGPTRSGGILRWSWRAVAVLVLASIATPFHINGWWYAVILASEAGSGGPEVMRGLAELSPTFGAAARRGLAFWVYLLLLGATLVSALWVFRRNRSLSLSRTAVVLGMLFASFSGRRNLPLFALVAAPFISECLGDLKRPRWLGHGDWFRMGLACVLAAAALFPLSGAYYRWMEIPARFGVGATPSFFPHGLPEFLDEIRFSGRVLNSNSIGGFYMYHGFPERLPLTDGRWEIYEAAELTWIRVGTHDPVKWRLVVSRYGIKGIVLAHTSSEASSILSSLAADPAWKLVYLDLAASFWIDRELGGDLPEIVPTPENLPKPGRLDDSLILDRFLEGVDAVEAQAALLAELVLSGMRQERILARLGKAQLRLERFDEAESTYQLLLNEDPSNAGAMNELAYLRVRKGDHNRAVSLLRRALEEEPGNQEVIENLLYVESMMRR